MANTKPNAVLVTSSNWHTMDSIRTNGKAVKANPKQPYVTIFGKTIRISRNDIKLYASEGFNVEWR